MTSALCHLLAVAAAVSLGTSAAEEKERVNLEFNNGQDRGGAEWVQAIAVSEPAPRSEVRGEVTVKFQARGMAAAKALR